MGGAAFGVVFDLAPFERQVNDAVAKQIPFATAKALTMTAKDAQGAIRADLPKSFTVRTTWIDKGIRVKPATKKSLVAEVGSKDAFMAMHATGGTKTAKDGKTMGVPSAARKKKTDMTRPSRWPGALAQRPKHFIAPLNKNLFDTGRPVGGSQRWGVYRRLGKGRYPLEVLYVFTREAKVKPNWQMRDIVRDVVRNKWPQHARDALVQALKTRTDPKMADANALWRTKRRYLGR